MVSEKKIFLCCCKLNIQTLGFVVSEKKIFLCFYIISLSQIIMPPGRCILDPRGMVGRINKMDY